MLKLQLNTFPAIYTNYSLIKWHHFKLETFEIDLVVSRELIEPSSILGQIIKVTGGRHCPQTVWIHCHVLV